MDFMFPRLYSRLGIVSNNVLVSGVELFHSVLVRECHFIYHRPRRYTQIPSQSQCHPTYSISSTFRAHANLSPHRTRRAGRAHCIHSYPPYEGSRDSTHRRGEERRRYADDSCPWFWKLEVQRNGRNVQLLYDLPAAPRPHGVDDPRPASAFKMTVLPDSSADPYSCTPSFSRPVPSSSSHTKVFSAAFKEVPATRCRHY
jgi:hypothetical protein